MRVGEIIFVVFLLVVTLAMQVHLWSGYGRSSAEKDVAAGSEPQRGTYIALLIFLAAVQALALRSALQLRLASEFLVDTVSVTAALVLMVVGKVLSRWKGR